MGVVLAEGMVSQADKRLLANHPVSLYLYAVQEIDMIFDFYDRSGDGRIDYKEFSSILVSGGANSEPVQA